MLTITNEDNMLLMARYPDNYFDLAIVDPPYKIGSQQKRGVGSRIDKSGKMNGWNNELPTSDYFNELFRVSKNQIIWGANNYEGLPRTEYFTIWNKEQTVDNFASLEYAWVSMGIGKPAKMYTYSIHKHNNTKGEKIHPTMKPVQLYKYLLDTYAKKNDKILDTHLGSGSIAIACHDYGFDLTACELDKEYFDKAMERINNHTNQQKLF
jgi:site-specific DNA-methyltransferase (adenine-specific)